MVVALVPGVAARLEAHGRRLSPALVAACGAAAIVIAIAIAGVTTSGLVNNVVSTGEAAMVRREFVATSMRMLRQAPLFGIGIGTYYPSSWYYMPFRLFLEYRHENAHNNFLQIGSELGVTGLLAFMGVLGAVMMKLGTAAGRGADASRARAILVGLGAFLVTCLTGHPLLVREVAYPFWIILGAALAIGRENAPPTADHGGRWLVAAGIAVLVLSVPARVATASPASNGALATTGLGPGEHTREGTPFRRIRGAATLFAPPQTTTAHIPIWGGGSRSDVVVRILVDGGVGSQVPMLPAAWTVASVHMAPLPDAHSLHRIDLVTLCGQSQTDCDPSGEGASVGRISVYDVKREERRDEGLGGDVERFEVELNLDELDFMLASAAMLPLAGHPRQRSSHGRFPTFRRRRVRGRRRVS